MSSDSNLPLLDDSGKQPFKRRRLYPENCRKANSHFSASAAIQLALNQRLQCCRQLPYGTQGRSTSSVRTARLRHCNTRPRHSATSSQQVGVQAVDKCHAGYRNTGLTALRYHARFELIAVSPSATTFGYHRGKVSMSPAENEDAMLTATTASGKVGYPDGYSSRPPLRPFESNSREEVAMKINQSAPGGTVSHALASPC